MPLLTLLRRRRILALWIAQLLSVLGDRWFALAIMWLALERSGPIAMGAVAIVESVPFILIGMFGHRLLTRCASFRTLAAIDAARAVVVLLVPIMWAAAGLPAMLAAVAALGVLAALFDPSLGALIPDLVDEHERPALVAAMDLTSRIARIAGPALAGALLLFTPVPVLFAADAATFAVSVLALAFVARSAKAARTVAEPTRTATPTPSPANARTLLREHPALSAAFAVHAAGFFLNALPAIGLPLLLAHQLDAGPSAYGWVLTATGTAALVGNLAAARLRPAATFLPRFCAAWAISGVLLAATGAASSLAWILAFASLSGFVSPFISITLGARLAAFEHPARLRLLTINHTVMRGAGTAGMAIIPFLIAPAPAQGFILGGTALAVFAATAWAVAAASARVPRMRSVRVVETAASTTGTGSSDQAA